MIRIKRGSIGRKYLRQAFKVWATRLISYSKQGRKSDNYGLFLHVVPVKGREDLPFTSFRSGIVDSADGFIRSMNSDVCVIQKAQGEDYSDERTSIDERDQSQLKGQRFIVKPTYNP
jgi:hypothetical protein